MRRAFGADLAAVALTDHDTVAGIREASQEAQRLRLTFIPGVEISVAEQGRELHILGYFIDPANHGLIDMLLAMTRQRRERLGRMVDLMRQNGLTISTDDIEREAAQSSAVGRLHIARALVRHGQARNIGECFKVWLGASGKAYVPKETPSPESVVATIKAAGGVAVLAHPGWLSVTALDELHSRLTLTGIEVDHPSHSPGAKRKLADWTTVNGLIATGGSDWHGNENSESYLGNRRVSIEVVAALRDRATGSC
jgi:3',5'-nucleoside bisphosphate phosphatase